MLFARRVFLVAAIYGFIVLLPQYFLEDKTGRDFPPAITHPEYYYGFIGVALAWQIVFCVISRDPIRYRLTSFSFRLATLVELPELERLMEASIRELVVRVHGS